MFRGSVKGTGCPLHSLVSPSLPSRASPCAITFQLDSTYGAVRHMPPGAVAGDDLWMVVRYRKAAVIAINSSIDTHGISGEGADSSGGAG